MVTTPVKRMRTLAGAAVAVAAGSLTVAAAAGAATIPVTNTANAGAGSLRAAIAAANATAAADGIPIDAEGTINLQSALPDLATDMTIEGPGADRLAVRRDSGGAYRILTMTGDPEIGISGVTVTNGRPAPFLGTDFASTRGGGIEADGTVELTEVAVVGNVASAGGEPGADAEGGGIVNFGTLTIRRSTISDNDATASGIATAHARGGGIAGGGALTVVASTVSANEARATGGSTSIQSVGGGLFNPGAVRAATVAGNAATEDGAPSAVGGSNLFTNGTTTIQSTIVADPVGAVSCRGPFISLGHNLDEDRSCLITRPTDIGGRDPGLAPLGDFGGPTLTHALSSDSPAIDQGACDGPRDQRGATRPSDLRSVPNAAGGDGSDIGAFELQAPDPPGAGECPAPPPQQISPPGPSAEFSFGRVKKNKRRGTAKLTVIVPGPGDVELAKTGKVKGADRRAEAAGEVRLPIKPRGKAKKGLRTRGKAKVTAEVTYTPDAGEPNTDSRSLKLKRKQ